MISNKTAKYAVTVPVMAALVLGQVVLMIYSMRLMDNATNIFGADSWTQV
jgi:hypothetical protein